MSNKSFKNGGKFDNSPGSVNIDGFNVTTSIVSITDPNQRQSSILFDGDTSTETGTISSVSVVWPGSYFSDGVVRQYVSFVDIGYSGKEFAIIDKDRLAARFTCEFTLLSTGMLAHQTITSIDNNSVSPEMRRLYNLGYI